MKVDNPLREKSYAFALRISKLCIGIQNQQKEFVLSKQLLRSGTSIGANVEESIGGHSKKDFYYRITLAYREARESHYWIRLLTDLGFIDKVESVALIADVEEVLRLSGSIKKTLQKQLESES